MKRILCLACLAVMVVLSTSATRRKVVISEDYGPVTGPTWVDDYLPQGSPLPMYVLLSGCTDYVCLDIYLDNKNGVRALAGEPVGVNRIFTIVIGTDAEPAPPSQRPMLVSVVTCVGNGDGGQYLKGITSDGDNVFASLSWQFDAEDPPPPSRYTLGETYTLTLEKPYQPGALLQPQSLEEYQAPLPKV